MRNVYIRSVFLFLIFIHCNNAQASVSETSQYCRAVQNQAMQILAHPDTPNFSTDLIEFSSRHPVNNDCYRWQLVVLNNLKGLPEKPSGFRQYLFNRVKKEGEDVNSEFLIHTLYYALSISSLEESEWVIIKELLSIVDENTLQSVILGLVTSRFEGEGSLQDKMADIFTLAKNDALSSDPTMTLSHAIELFLQVTTKQRPELSSLYYQKYFYLLDEQANTKLSAEVVSFFRENQNSHGLIFLSTFIGNAQLSESLSRDFFLLLLRLHKEKNNNSYYLHVVNTLVSEHPHKVRLLIENAQLSEKRKDLLKIEYKLDTLEEYRITDYASQLFSETLRQQRLAADYLVAFGQRANVVKYDVQSKFLSIKEDSTNNSSAKLILSLLKVLTNIGSSDPETISMLVWALDRNDYRISKQALAGLKTIGASALSEYIKNFQNYSAKVQPLIVEVMGTFENEQLPAVKFLSQINPKSDKIRFAIEDAVVELNEF